MEASKRGTTYRGSQRPEGSALRVFGLLSVHPAPIETHEIVEAQCLPIERMVPVRQIAANGGIEGAIVLEKIKLQTDGNFGYNAATDQYEDLVKWGVIDPTKVTRTALQNAASIASLMLTTEAMICELSEAEA